MTPAPSHDAQQPTHYRWTVFSLAFGTSWLLYLHRYIFALIKPKLQEEWGLGKDELGLLDSAFSLFYTGFQIPIGIAVDAIGVHFILTAMIVVWSIGLAMHAWAPSKDHLWFARATIGIGQSAVFAALLRTTKTWIPPVVRTTAQGWIGVFAGRFGGLSANLIVGSVLLGIFEMPWRTVVYVMAGVGIVHAVLFASLFRNSPRKHPSVNEAEADLIEEGSVGETKQSRMSVTEMFQRMSPKSICNVLFLNAQTILSTLADNIYSAWIPLFLYEVHGLKFKEMGFYSALPLLGGALGGAMGGWLNDRMIRQTGNRRTARSGIGFLGKVLAGILLLAALLMYDHPRLFCGMLFFVKFFSDWSLTTTWGTITDIGGKTSASVFAYNNSVAGIASILGPALYGFIAEYYGWVPVFIVAAVTYLVCASSWLLIDCTVPIFGTDNEAATGPKRDPE